jgi:hypothetical protein
MSVKGWKEFGKGLLIVFVGIPAAGLLLVAVFGLIGSLGR